MLQLLPHCPHCGDVIHISVHRSAGKRIESERLADLQICLSQNVPPNLTSLVLCSEGQFHHLHMMASRLGPEFRISDAKSLLITTNVILALLILGSLLVVCDYVWMLWMRRKLVYTLPSPKRHSTNEPPAPRPFALAYCRQNLLPPLHKTMVPL